jgi:PPM family protein phosphatase
MHVGFATHTGQRRQNQDNALIDQDIGLFAVADGVGGGDSGEVASASVCLSLHREVTGGLDVDDAIRLAHKELMEQPATGNAGYAASTIVVMQKDRHQIKLAWVGDSRIYLLRDNSLYQLSEDHSVVQQVAGLSELDMQRIRHVLTQAVGVAGEDGLAVDSFEVDRYPGDCWLLCTDGLHGVVTEKDIQEVLSTAVSADEKATRLLDLALAKGADDNVTLIVIAEDDDYELPPEVASKAVPREVPAEPVEQQELPENQHVSAPQVSSSKPWHYIVLGGLLAVLLFFALIWGL